MTKSSPPVPVNIAQSHPRGPYESYQFSLRWLLLLLRSLQPHPVGPRCRTIFRTCKQRAVGPRKHHVQSSASLRRGIHVSKGSASAGLLVVEVSPAQGELLAGALEESRKQPCLCSSQRSSNWPATTSKLVHLVT